MKKNLGLTGVLAIISFLVSCGPTLKVTADYDKSVNFSQYKTFYVYKGDELKDHVTALNADRIVNSIRNEMVKKGFQEADTTADLLINPVAILKDKVSVNANTNYYGYGGMYRPYYWGAGAGYSSSTTYDVDHYKDGSLIIDVIDADTKKLVWQGIGNREIDGPIKDPDTVVPKAITSIMASFPPGAKKK